MIRGSTTWSAERVEMLTEMWRDGRSGGEIAARLGGVTRNAVIGKVHRLGLAGMGSTPTRSRIGKFNPKRVRKVKKHTDRVAAFCRNGGYKQTLKATPMSLTIAPLHPEDTPRGPLVMFADLEAHHCRAPYGDPKLPGFGFCGCKKVPGSSYCEDHHRRFFAAPKPRQPFVPGVPRQIHVVNSQVTPTEREDVFA